jgi:hypothetical protein
MVDPLYFRHRVHGLAEGAFLFPTIRLPLVGLLLFNFTVASSFQAGGREMGIRRRDIAASPSSVGQLAFLLYLADPSASS